jgi:hypothetical protein
MTSYIYETLPSPVVGTFGQTVSLSTILTQEFGPKYGGYTDFYVSYLPWQLVESGGQQFSYWTATTGSDGSADTMTQWLQNGAPDAPATWDFVGASYYKPTIDIPATDDPSSGVVHVTASNINQFSLQIGSDIGPFAFITVPVAFDSSHNPTEFVQYSITTTDPSLYAPVPAPYNVVDTAVNYFVKYQNVVNQYDCGFIAQDVASAAGAALDDLIESTNPKDNVEAGFWRIVYPGSDPNPVSNWSTLLEPGDIVRMGRKPTMDGKDGGTHTFTVLDSTPAGDGVHNLLTVYDNGASLSNGLEGIGIHIDVVPANSIVASDHYYDDEADPSEVTIYRLTPDHEYLIDASALGGDPTVGARLIGTAYDDHIIGSDGDDTFSSWTGNDLIDGGGGTNTLDYSWDNQGITADVLAGTVWKGAGNGTDQFSHIQKFIGSSAGGDVFYVGAGSFSFDGGSGFGKTLDYSSDQNFFYITVDLTHQTVSKNASTFFSGEPARIHRHRRQNVTPDPRPAQRA